MTVGQTLTLMFKVISLYRSTFPNHRSKVHGLVKVPAEKPEHKTKDPEKLVRQCQFCSLTCRIPKGERSSHIARVVQVVDCWLEVWKLYIRILYSVLRFFKHSACLPAFLLAYILCWINISHLELLILPHLSGLIFRQNILCYQIRRARLF